MKPLLRIFILLSLVTVYSCEDFLDCIVNRRPELPNKTFRIGTVGEYYYDEFDAEIKNEPRDNIYGYEFDVDNRLPDGLEIFANFRTLSIEGRPTTPGTYTFRVYLFVIPPVDWDNGGYDDPLCEEATSKEYTIIIDP